MLWIFSVFREGFRVLWTADIQSNRDGPVWLASLGLAKVALHLFTNEIICLVSWCGLLSGPCICYYYMFIYKKNCRLLQCLYTYLFLRTHAQIQLIGGDFFDSKLWNAWIFYSILFTAWKIPVYSTSAMFKEVH